MEANKGRTSVWLLDTRQTRRDAAAPHRRRSPTPGRPSGARTATFIYFLSNRSGTNQVWRVSSIGTGPRGDTPVPDSTQVTNLPLDVGSFHVSPKADRILVSVEVFLDCADLACTKQRLDASAHTAAHRRFVRQLFVQALGRAGATAGARSCSRMTLERQRRGANGTPVNLERRHRAMCPASHSAAARTTRSVRTARRWRSRCARTAGEPWSTNFDIYMVAADGSGTPQESHRRQSRRGMGSRPSRPTDRSSPMWRMDRPGFEADRFHLVLLNLQSGVKRPLTQNWDRSINELCLVARRQDACLRPTDHLGQRPLWAIDAATRQSIGHHRRRRSRRLRRRRLAKCSTPPSNLGESCGSVFGGIRRRQAVAAHAPQSSGRSSSASSANTSSSAFPAGTMKMSSATWSSRSDFKRDQQISGRAS